MKPTKLVWLAVFALGMAAQEPQGELTNVRVGDLVRMGVSTPEIIRIISTAPRVSFDLRPGSTDNLLKAGVSEEIIKVMAARELGQSVPTTASAPFPARPAAMAPAASSMPAPISVPEVGAYYQSNGQWVEMMPEVVNWKTGGVIKSLATAGIVKGDLNGRLRNGRSRLTITKPIRLLVYTPEGTQITEYQLIRLRTHSNAREFRTVTGGVFHVSGDSNRDDLPFDGQHVATRTWTISLDGLQPGEYGLLPPGAIEARSASAQLGKMYTFTVLE